MCELSHLQSLSLVPEIGTEKMQHLREKYNDEVGFCLVGGSLALRALCNAIANGSPGY